MAKDPVCKMDVDEITAVHYTHYRHETIYFCSEICKQSFDMDHESVKRSWWQRRMDRMIEANRKLFGENPSQTVHGGIMNTFPELSDNLGEAGLVIDPVCQMEIHKGEAADSRSYEGKIYYFCAVECGIRFDQHPEIYTGKMKDPLEGEVDQNG
ncbi:MAG: YHS domain-containing protein [Nitrospirae bacterium]|nr:YHS domain-containing protein [Nitrospirota bacterium]